MDRDEHRRGTARLAILDALIDALDRRVDLVITLGQCADRSEALLVLQQPPWGYSTEQAACVLDGRFVQATTSHLADLAEEREQLRRHLDHG